MSKQPKSNEDVDNNEKKSIKIELKKIIFIFILQLEIIITNIILFLIQKLKCFNFLVFRKT